MKNERFKAMTPSTVGEEQINSRLQGERKELPAEDEKDIKYHLKAMGHFFELDEKKVKFYIRQLELSKKI